MGVSCRITAKADKKSGQQPVKKIVFQVLLLRHRLSRRESGKTTYSKIMRMENRAVAFSGRVNKAEKVYDICCGIDVHKKLTVACLRNGREQGIRQTGATTRELRELVQYRKSLLEDKARELNRLQKMLEGGNIKLSETVRNINGMSARNILNCIVTGEKLDEAKFDEMRREGKIAHNLKAPKAQILDDLDGVLSPIQRRVMKELLSHLDELNEQIPESQ